MKTVSEIVTKLEMNTPYL